MKVKGIEITEAQIQAMLDAMSDRFRASDLEAAAVKAGAVGEGVALRAADRLLQQQRKKGVIQTLPEDKPYWTKL
jgi:fructose-1-phosphate kinase PfkB-like protein